MDDQPKVVKLTQELASALRQLIDSKPLGAKPRQLLEGFYEAMQEMGPELERIHIELVDLHLADQELHAEARMSWERLPGKRYHSSDKEILEIIDKSATLTELHRAGITLKSLRKFSEAEFKLAKTLGDSFEDCYGAWNDFKRLLTHKNTYFEFRRQGLEQVMKLDTLLRQNGIIKTNFLERRDQTTKWVAVTERMLRLVSPGVPCRITFNDIAFDKGSLLQGEWLTAYAYMIIEEHARRNRLDYELFSLVQYEAPPDVLRVSGDFDILLREADQFALIECKSGRLREEREVNDFRDICLKADDLRQVFEAVGANIQCNFALLYNPHLSEPETVEKALDGSLVQPIRPDQVRRYVLEMLK